MGYFFSCLLSPKAQRTGSQKAIPQEGVGATGQPSCLQEAMAPLRSVAVPRGRAMQVCWNKISSLNSYCYLSSSWVWFKFQPTLPISIMALPHFHLSFSKMSTDSQSIFSRADRPRHMRKDFANEDELATCQLIFIWGLNTLSYLYNLYYH